MRSTLLMTMLLVGLNAHAWGWRDHRTYYHPAPVIVHPINQTYPVYYHSTAPALQWRRGYWSHSWHANRFGWWWVNGGGWSYYAAPSYPYPDPVPQTTIIYESAPTVYEPAPQVQTAPPQIVQVEPPAPVSGNTAPPSNGMYYFCESSQLYYPYAKTCSERWKAVPSLPSN